MSAGPRQWQFEFSESGLTHFGGMVLIQRFCQKIRLRWLLQRDVQTALRRVEYWPADLFLALLYAVIAGLRRINKTEILQYNGTFLNLLGLDRFLDQSRLRRFLKTLSPTVIRQLVRLHDRLRPQWFEVPYRPGSLLFDLDSVVVTVYGKPQGARLGYNPKKKGRRSYHPLLCFEATRQEFWHGSLRPGDLFGQHRGGSFYAAVLGQDSSGMATVAGARSSGLRLLWEQVHPLLGSYWLRLRHRSQNVSHPAS
jgi:hypothetical protein